MAVTDPKAAMPHDPPRPTLEDVARLTPESDYHRFTAPGVDPRVRNEALKKLFLGDPHFRQSDDLNVRVDEVVAEAGSSLARQRKIRQARALGLLDDDLVDQSEPTEVLGPLEPLGPLERPESPESPERAD